MFCHLLLFVVKFFLMFNLSSRFASGFHPITIQNHAVVSDRHLLFRFSKIRDWLKCIVKCQNHSKCLSYNYRHRKKRVEGPLCEMYKCGLDPSKADFKRSLHYSSGMIFQQLKASKDGQYCKEINTTRPQQLCRTGWIPHETSCYKAVKKNRSWQDASSNCQSIGSNLTSVVNQNQNDFLVSLSTVFTRNYFWIGFVKAAQVFKWQDGSSSTYNNWATSEPSTTASYDCVNMKREDGTWRNWDCSTLNPSICKYDPTSE